MARKKRKLDRWDKVFRAVNRAMEVEGADERIRRAALTWAWNRYIVHSEPIPTSSTSNDQVTNNVYESKTGLQ